MSDDNKTIDDVIHAEAFNYGISAEDARLVTEYSGKREKQILRKIDLRLVPLLTLMYLSSHIDRSNLGNAKIEGMESDLHLKGNQYNIASTIFYVPYIIFEIPSNMVLKKVRPSYWLAFLMLSWGLVMTMMGIVQDAKGLYICRIMLGVCEAGFFPGAVYVITLWYRRSEVQTRLAIFYTASACSGAFSGLLAFAIANLDGACGLAGWRWIFLIEGAVTLFLALLIPFLLADSPTSASWLSQEEKRFIQARLIQDGVINVTQEGDHFSWPLFFHAVFDIKVWAGIVMAWSNCVTSSAFSFTMPQIIKDLGFTASKAQLLTIPPYFCGAMSTLTAGRLADHYKWRFPFIAAPLCILVTGIAILFSFSSAISTHVGVMYFAIIIAQIGIYPLQPCVGAWTGNNLAPTWKRNIGLAWVFAGGNLGSLVGTNIFLSQQAPRYQTGYGTSLAFIVLGLAASIALEIYLKLSNVKKAEMEGEALERCSREELEKMGDKSPTFKYIL